MENIFTTLPGLNGREKELLNLMAVLLIEKPCGTKKLASKLGFKDVQQDLVNQIVDAIEAAGSDDNADLADLINGTLSSKCCG
jgi:hypothetical protein